MGILKKVALDPRCPAAANCPAIYLDDSNGSVVIQGSKIDKGHRLEIGMPDNEDAVEIPREVFEQLIVQLHSH